MSSSGPAVLQGRAPGESEQDTLSWVGLGPTDSVLCVLWPCTEAFNHPTNSQQHTLKEVFPLQELCKKLHEQIDISEEERYCIEFKLNMVLNEVSC